MSTSFDVASVKILPRPSPSVSTGGGPGTSDPGRFVRSNITLTSLLVEAFHIQGHAIAGSDWLRSTRYEIIAKVPIGANRDDIPLMLQRLITERFGLTSHREQKEMPGARSRDWQERSETQAFGQQPSVYPRPKWPSGPP